MAPQDKSRLGVFRAPYRRIRRSGRGSNGVAVSLEEASRRIADVAAAADRAAEEIHAGLGRAPDPGRPNVIDRERIAFELTKTLLERTESLRAQAAELSRIVERASTQLRAIESISGHLEARAPAGDAGPPAPADFTPRDLGAAR